MSSPTVTLEALFTSLSTDAKERRKVATFDVPGDLFQPDMPETNGRIQLKLRGEFVDIMCEVNTAYKSTVIYGNGEKVLYMLVLRSIYGCIMAALLWYDLYTLVLK